MSVLIQKTAFSTHCLMGLSGILPSNTEAFSWSNAYISPYTLLQSVRCSWFLYTYLCQTCMQYEISEFCRFTQKSRIIWAAKQIPGNRWQAHSKVWAHSTHAVGVSGQENCNDWVQTVMVSVMQLHFLWLILISV